MSNNPTNPNDKKLTSEVSKDAPVRNPVGPATPLVKINEHEPRKGPTLTEKTRQEQEAGKKSIGGQKGS